jgi:HKD family nuclease
MIGRRNILELIGKNRGKYHSCILTCYSLDFSFFEERVLPILRTANIKNVNVFADGKFLEVAQDVTTGHEFKFNKTYNFLPVYTTGVFHPKIMLLVGVKHGLLIIGSGNITSSGLSTNDEIWGAFHLNSVENDNTPLFAAVWEYLQQFLNESYGFINQKIDWIRKYSPWLADLPEPTHEIQIESLKQQISFIANNDNESILAQLKATIPNAGVKSLSLISPYYDKEGEIIKELGKQFNPDTFNCIVDLDFGLLPYELDKDLATTVNFYKWSDCIKDFHEEVNRLHAKMIHFSMSDGTEYMMLGSANATNAALGTSSKKAVNHEAGILIKRTSTSNTWLHELQIKLPADSIGMDKFKDTGGRTSPKVSSSSAKIKIVYAELRGTELSIYTKSKLTETDLKVLVLSREGAEIESIPFEMSDKSLVAKCSASDDVFKIVLANDQSEMVSNYCLVHRLEALIKCNPDPQQEKLDELLDEEYPDGEGITQLLEYVDYNWADEDSKNTKYHVSGGGAGIKSKSGSPNQHYETLSEEDFNAISDDALFQQTGEMSHPSVKIADFLGIVGSELAIRHSDDFSESEEQKLLEAEVQQGEGNTVESNKKKKNNAIKVRNAILRYFRNLDSQYTMLLESFYRKKELFETPHIPINIKAFSNILIALQLIQIYHGKRFDIESDEEFKQESYLIDGSIFDSHKTIKGFLNNVLGKFLLLSTAGVKKYEYDVLNKKLEYYQYQVLEKTIFTILKLHWHENELVYRDNILLNTLFFLHKNIEDKDIFVENLKSRIWKQKNGSKYSSRYFTENF